MKNHLNCFVNIDSDDINIVVESLNESIISGKGRYVEQFERDLTNYFKADYALTCCNATAGIHMILIMNGVSYGDEVILPPTAPVMSVLPILAVGAIPIFVDNQPNSFLIDLSDLSRKITVRTKLLINVPMWGYANNIDEISIICKKKNIKLLEDNSHCHGTKLGKSFLGTYGDYAIFSTHERKLVTTGEGAFFLIKEKSDYIALKELRSFGELNSDDFTYAKGSYGIHFGLNFKMSSINAALGVTQLRKLDSKILRRYTNASYLRGKINSIEEISEINIIPDSENNNYSIVLLTSPNLKDKIEDALGQKGIISDPMRYSYRPLYKMPLFEQYANYCPNAEHLTKSVFTLPTHEHLEIEDLNNYISIIQNEIQCTNNSQLV